MAQKYNKIPKFSKNFEISGYHWLFFVLNQKEICAKLGITMAYIKHLPMFNEYLDLQSHNEKKTYVYEYLGGKYGMHTSSVRRVISRLLRVVSV
jgi:hypothetical protein